MLARRLARGHPRACGVALMPKPACSGNPVKRNGFLECLDCGRPMYQMRISKANGHPVIAHVPDHHKVPKSE